jgi:predicted ATPase/tRNA A-37 threonylcarbamoyl transferase component Bud32/tetratricopeptide (TPR) repeat protein
MGQAGSTQCLASDTIVAYVAGQLDGQSLERVDDHVASCDECALLVAAGAIGMDGDVDSAEVGSARGSVARGFEVLEVIGRGGMATVHRGRDRSTGGTVAIKRLRVGRSSEKAENIARFAREVAILRRLNHPNIVRIHASVVRADEHQIVMEYVPGGTLRTTLQKHGALSAERALPLVLELSDALARSHHVGVIHRDIKPENVLIAADGSPRLADFGLARLTGEPLTTGNLLLGTLPYICPESLAGARLDEKADVWALGVTLFEMLVGRRPFEGETPSALMASILRSPLPDLASILPGTPLALTSLLRRLLNRERAARPGAREVGATIEAICKGEASPGLSNTSRAQAPVARTLSPRRRLPVATTPFFGRKRELAEIVALLARRETRLLTLVAPGGMGKSRLALEAARMLQSGSSPSPRAFRDGVAFVDLTLIDAPDLVVSAVASALSFVFPPGGDLRSLLLDYLVEKQLLLILDNFEHVAPAAAFVGDLLLAAPEVQVMATSRQALLLGSEVRFTLAGLSMLEGAAPEDDDAIQLFDSCARRVVPDFDWREQRADIARVCQLVQGMPLGIVLAAAWVNALGVGEVAEEIVRNLDFLRAERADLPERQRSVRAIFEHSWGLLCEEDRDVFARLSIFHGGFVRRAAEEVAHATPRQLKSLVEKSLITWDPASGRYDVHELLRQFGESELSATSDRYTDTMSRLVEHVVEFLGRERGVLEGPLQRRGVESVEAEVGNVRAAWRWMLKHRQIEQVDAVMWALLLFHYRRGSRGEVDAAFASVIETFSPFEAWGATGQRVGALALAFRGILAEEQGHMTAAVEALEQARRLTATAAPGSEHGLSLITAGWVLLRAQNREACLAGAQRGLEMFRAGGDGWGLAFALMVMARVYYRAADNPAGAEASLLESIALQQRVYGEVILPSALGGLGALRRARGDWAGALTWFSSALETAERLGDLWTVQDVLQVSSQAQLNLGNFAAAEALVARCIELSLETGGLADVTVCQLQLGHIMSVQGRLGEAEEQYGRALRASAPGSVQRAAAEMNLAEVARRRGKFRQAERGLSNSLKIFEGSGTEWGIAAAAAYLGVLACDELRFDDARKHCRRALGSSVRACRPGELLDALFAVARLGSSTHRRVEAVEICGLIQSHPALERPLRSLRLDPLLEELRSTLASAELEAALERGRAMDSFARASSVLARWEREARPERVG